MEYRIPLGYQQIAAAGSQALTVPTGALYAVIQAEDGTFRWRDDGTAPTTSVGMQLHSGTSLPYEADLAAIRIIRAVAGVGKLNVSYYR